MKRIMMLLWLMASGLQAQTDSTWLDLGYKTITPQTKQITIIINASNSTTVDIAGFQSTVMFPEWLTLINFTALQADSTPDNSKSGSYGPRNVKPDTVKQNVLYFANNMTTPAVRNETPIAQLTFKVDSAKHLVDQERIWFILDNIKLSDWNQAVRSNKRLSLMMVVGTDTTKPDTTHHDSTNVRYQATMSLSPGGAHNGYQLDSNQAIIQVDLDHRAIINQISFQLNVPDTNWRLTSITPINKNGGVDYEKVSSFNRLADGQYSILVSGDKAEHPWLPSLKQTKWTILKLILSRPVAPFGNQTFAISGMSTYSSYEPENITVNQLAELSINLNPFFGQVIGRKGDLQFQNWKFGDGRVDSLDLKIAMDIITQAITPNDYQAWAVDLNNDDKRNAQDITAIQELIAISGVADYTLKSWQVNYHDNSLSLQKDNGLPLTVSLYDLQGQLISSKKYFNSETIILDLPAGYYLCHCQTLSETLFKKIIIH